MHNLQIVSLSNTDIGEVVRSVAPQLSGKNRDGFADPLLEMRFGVESVFDNAPVGLCVLDLSFRYVTVNACFAQLYNLSKHDIVGKTVQEALPGPAPQILANLREAISSGRTVEREIVLRNPATGIDEDEVTYLRTAQPLRNDYGVIYGISVATLDITARKQAEKRLLEVQDDLRFTVELTPHVPWQCDASGELTFMSHRWNSITGTTGSVRLKEWAEVVHPDDLRDTADIWSTSVLTGKPYDAEYRIHSASGGWRWVRARAYPRRSDGGEIIRWYGTVEDIHDKKLTEMRLREATEELARRAREDHLTGLPNRRYFDEVLMREVGRARRINSSTSLLMIDVDFFKRFNDIAGHLQGDECLRAVACAIRSTIRRPGDFAARFGGEEFVVLLPDTALTGAYAVAKSICDKVRGLNFMHSDPRVRQVTVSAGVAMVSSADCSNPAVAMTNLIQAADKALYKAKASGRNAVSSFS